MDKKSPKGRKRSAKGSGAGPSSSANNEDDGTWDCSVCTFKNHPEAFKCSMCDVRKGTSTRKPRINPDLVAAQHAQALTPPPPLSTTPTPLASTSAYDYMDEDDEEEELTPPPKVKKISAKEKKAVKAAAAKEKEKEKEKETPVKDKETPAKEKKEKNTQNKAKLKNVDRSSATYHSVTVDDITVVITEFKPKKPKEKKEKKEGAGTKKESKKDKEKDKEKEAENGEGPSTSTGSTPNGKVKEVKADNGNANGAQGGLAYVKSGATPLSPPGKVKREEKVIRPSIKKEEPTSPPGSGAKSEPPGDVKVKSEGQASSSNGKA